MFHDTHGESSNHKSTPTTLQIERGVNPMKDNPTLKSGQAAYRALKMHLTRAMIGYSDVAVALGRSLPYIRVRMSGKGSFTVSEAYAILDKLGLDESWFLTIFPRDPYEFPNIEQGGQQHESA